MPWLSNQDSNPESYTSFLNREQKSSYEPEGSLLIKIITSLSKTCETWQNHMPGIFKPQ